MDVEDNISVKSADNLSANLLVPEENMLNNECDNAENIQVVEPVKVQPTELEDVKIEVIKEPEDVKANCSMETSTNNEALAEINNSLLKKDSTVDINNTSIFNLNEISADTLQSFIRLLGQCTCLWCCDTPSSLSERREAYYYLLTKLKESKPNATFRDVYNTMRQLSLLSKEADILNLPRILRSNEKYKRNRMILEELFFLQNPLIFKQSSRNVTCTFCLSSFTSHDTLWKHMKIFHAPNENDQTYFNNLQVITNEELCEDCFNIKNNMKIGYFNSKSLNNLINSSLDHQMLSKSKRVYRNNSKITSKLDKPLAISKTIKPKKRLNNKITKRGPSKSDKKKHSETESVTKNDNLTNKTDSSDIEMKAISENQKDNYNDTCKKNTVDISNKRFRNSLIRSKLKINNCSKKIIRDRFSLQKVFNNLNNVTLLEETTKSILDFAQNSTATCFNDYDDHFFEEFIKAYRQHPCLWSENWNGNEYIKTQRKSMRHLAKVYNKLVPNKPIMHMNQLYFFIRRLRAYYKKYLELRNETVNKLIPRSNIWEQMTFINEDPINEDSQQLSSNSVLPSVRQIYEQMKGYRKKNEFSCGKCNRKYKISKRLAHHMKLKHPLTKCFCCKKDFSNADNLKKHVIKIHLNEEKCPLCPSMHVDDSLISRQKKWYGDKHLSKHFNNFCCMLCEKAFHDYKNYINHLKNCEQLIKKKTETNLKSIKDKETKFRRIQKKIVPTKPVLQYVKDHLAIVDIMKE